jgi:hypothetical protein
LPSIASRAASYDHFHAKMVAVRRENLADGSSPTAQACVLNFSITDVASAVKPVRLHDRAGIFPAGSFPTYQTPVHFAPLGPPLKANFQMGLA